MSHVAPHTEPIIRLSKRDTMPAWKGILVRILGILLGVALSSLFIVLVTDLNPIEVFTSLFDGCFGTPRRIWNLFQNTAILLCISLAVTPAYKMKFWNIGAEGQVLMGAAATAACMIYFGNTINQWLLIPIMIIASLFAGMVWGMIPAFFKAYFNTNETLFTLMMNYVATQIVAFLITYWENPKGSNSVGVINAATKAGWFPYLFGKQYLINIIVVVLLTVIMYIYLKYSKHGYEISVVGESENTARYIGINVKKVILRTMALSGALCGIAGLLLVAGSGHTVSTSTAGGRGFTAILVSWLAKFNPAVMTLTSFLIVFFERGAAQIATAFRMNESLADIITGIILFFIIGSEFFLNYKVNFRHKHKEVA
ncbi:MAG: ABC transporter permease [Ruminococcaceae bacterium]|nr:ABC transporter permease [Oscillospiraceae bacterium]